MKIVNLRLNAASLIGLSTLMLFASTAVATPSNMPRQAAYSWKNVQIVGGGFVDALIFSPVQKDLVFARTDIGGGYRWDAATSNWIPLNDWFTPDDWNLNGCESIGVDPVDARRVYMAVGTYTNSWGGNGAIVRSVDQGRTWKMTRVPFKNGGNMDGRSAGERLAVDPNKDSVLYFGSRDNGLWKSTDFGATWSQVTTFPVTGPTNGTGVVFVVFDRASGKSGRTTPTIYVGVSKDGATLYRSTDAGESWAPVSGEPSGLLPHHGVLDATGSLYLTYGNAPGPNGMSAGAVWKYETGSGLWTDISPIKESKFGYAGLAVDPQHHGTVMVMTMDRWNPTDTLYRSTDGGKRWEDVGPDAILDPSLSPFVTFGAAKPKFGWWMGALAVDPFRPGHVMFGTGATIWESDDVSLADSGQPTHWYVGARGLEETAVNDLISPPAGAHLFSALGDIGGFRHVTLTESPAGGIWKNPEMNGTNRLAYAELLPKVVVRVGNGTPGGAFSTDYGATWMPFSTGPEGGKGGGTVAVSSDAHTIVWCPDGTGPAWSTDRGESWAVSVGAPGSLNLVADSVNPNRFYGLDQDSGTVYSSQDGGKTFAPRASNLPHGGGRLRSTPGHEGDLWLATGNTLFHSTDSGGSFAALTTATDVRASGFGKAAPNQSYPTLFILGKVDGDPGIYRSTDRGLTWIRTNDDQHQYGTADVIIGDPRIFGRVYVGTNGRGVLYGDPAH